MPIQCLFKCYFNFKKIKKNQSKWHEKDQILFGPKIGGGGKISENLHFYVKKMKSYFRNTSILSTRPGQIAFDCCQRNRSHQSRPVGNWQRKGTSEVICTGKTDTPPCPTYFWNIFRSTSPSYRYVQNAMFVFKVLGLGPAFTLVLSLENVHQSKPLMNTMVVFHCNPTMYALSNYTSVVSDEDYEKSRSTKWKYVNQNRWFLQIPFVSPGLTYKMETKVRHCLANNAMSPDQCSNILTSEPIRVFVVRKGQVQPVLAATINMPSTDPLGYIF